METVVSEFRPAEFQDRFIARMEAAGIKVYRGRVIEEEFEIGEGPAIQFTASRRRWKQIHRETVIAWDEEFGTGRNPKKR